MLQMPSEWVFGSPGELPSEAVSEFFDLAVKISEQGESWSILELFKAQFGGTGQSSSQSWAVSDLRHFMDASAQNAPTFIASFWRGMDRVGQRYPSHPLPKEGVINAILSKHSVPYVVQPPALLPLDGYSPPVVSVPEATVDEKAKVLIEGALAQADMFLLDNKPRQAVQEVLWLLETVSTAFAGQAYGGGVVEGKYFNKIVRDLQKQNHGTVLAQAGSWMTALHGFLSSPSGGGVRHGTHLATGKDLTLHEATLFCNLTRSYVGYLLAELSKLPKG